MENTEIFNTDTKNKHVNFRYSIESSVMDRSSGIESKLSVRQEIPNTLFSEKDKIAFDNKDDQIEADKEIYVD